MLCNTGCSRDYLCQALWFCMVHVEALPKDQLHHFLFIQQISNTGVIWPQPWLPVNQSAFPFQVCQCPHTNLQFTWKSQVVFHSSLCMWFCAGLTLVNGAPDQDLYWGACGRSILCCCIYLSSTSICNHTGCNKNLLGILSLQETRQSTLRSGKHTAPQGSIAPARAVSAFLSKHTVLSLQQR